VITIKRILIAIECLDYEFLSQCHTPNIDNLDPHPAIPLGITTGAATGAFTKGLLPICIYKDCNRHRIKWQNPFFLRNVSKETNFLAYVPNGWAMDFFLPYLSKELVEKNYQWHRQHEECVSLKMLEDFTARKLNNYFTYFHLMESHPPFFHPDWKGMDPGQINKSPNTPDPPTRRRMAVEWIDREIISRILKLNYEEFVITADHPLAHPGDEREFIQELEEGRSPQKYQVFLATDIRR